MKALRVVQLVGVLLILLVVLCMMVGFIVALSVQP